ncbi:hypothetical protein CTAM01_08285 [Colletotrichum tamarilloi]|uniref:Uncharacterized protein n=1 Tax=Colletotrichum tamarilloi TaxID=1209934 RepID=A0ABQ9R6T5_9PEZI|nr:uncharacterized protein CTAM01_08285 [Colletotrichum tamarilloi]KAK1496647.1 hypothetical protein CTAM01_08285 [Colletotrichum tamarilloi]
MEHQIATPRLPYVVTTHIFTTTDMPSVTTTITTSGSSKPSTIAILEKHATRMAHLETLVVELGLEFSAHRMVLGPPSHDGA